MRICLVLLISVLMVLPCRAENSESRYFNIKIHNGADSKTFLYQMGFVAPTQIDKVPQGGSINSLANNLDTLYLEISDVLDIHIYDFKINIEIFPDSIALKRMFQDKFRLTLKAKSFYYAGNNTLYVAQDDVRLGILAHEISHAIITRYFVVPPPEKLQEIMCGYVEYSIGKKVRYDAD